jgi:hypothetical protein
MATPTPEFLEGEKHRVRACSILHLIGEGDCHISKERKVLSRFHLSDPRQSMTYNYS